MNGNIAAQKATGSIRNQAIDLMKLVLSVFVVMIHSQVDLWVFSPFLRIAVPLFFITSSYYFFRKINSCETQTQRSKALGKLLKRNLTLYAFWFVVLLPITLYVRKGEWLSGSVVQGVVGFLQSLLFNSTFRASWYIMALCIGMCIIYLLSRKIKPEVLTVLMVPAYLLCCLFTNYTGLAERSELVMKLYDGYISVFRSLSNSFPVSLLWLSMGAVFAKQERSYNKKTLWIVIDLSALGLMAEYLLVSHYQLQNGDDAYLMLIPLCWALFALLKDVRLEWGARYRMGHVSTIIYASHASVITVLGAVVHKFVPNDGGWLVFVATMIACLCMSAVIFRLEKCRALHWLRLSY